MKEFKPMKGVDYQKVKEDLDFPIIASIKLDGLRCIIKDGKLFSSHLKEFKNPNLLEKFKDLMEISKEDNLIFDGELYSHELDFNVISGNIRSLSQNIYDSIYFWCFDIIDKTQEDLPYKDRLIRVKRKATRLMLCDMKEVETHWISNKEQLDELFDLTLKKGYEGLITRKPDSKYKFGRATPKSQELLKWKPFMTFDAKIKGVTQQYISTAEAQYNELGKSYRSHKKDDMITIERAASFECLMEDGTEISVSIGQEEEHRDYVWNNQNEFIGEWIEFKGMIVGSKDKPRHPIFIRYRDSKD